MVLYEPVCTTYFNMFQHMVPQFVVGYSPDSHAETCSEFMLRSYIREQRTYTDCGCIIWIIQLTLFIFPSQKKIGCWRKTDRAYLEKDIRQTDRQPGIGGRTVGSLSAKFCLPHILIQGLAVRLKFAILCPLWVKNMVQLSPQCCYFPVVDHRAFIDTAIR
jgi:hypothetical protein